MVSLIGWVVMCKRSLLVWVIVGCGRKNGGMEIAKVENIGPEYSSVEMIGITVWKWIGE